MRTEMFPLVMTVVSGLMSLYGAMFIISKSVMRQISKTTLYYMLPMVDIRLILVTV